MSLCPGVGGLSIGLIGLSGGGWIWTLNPAAAAVVPAAGGEEAADAVGLVPSLRPSRSSGCRC